MAHIRQSRPDSSLGCQLKALKKTRLSFQSPPQKRVEGSDLLEDFEDDLDVVFPQVPALPHAAVPLQVERLLRWVVGRRRALPLP